MSSNEGSEGEEWELVMIIMLLVDIDYCVRYQGGGKPRPYYIRMNRLGKAVYSRGDRKGSPIGTNLRIVEFLREGGRWQKKAQSAMI